MSDLTVSAAIDAFLAETPPNSTQQATLRALIDAAKVITEFIGPATLTSAASISWNVATQGRVASLTASDATINITLSSLADGEEIVLYVTQDGTGGRTVNISQSGLTNRGSTAAIADLGAGEFGVITAGRSGSNLFITVNTDFN